MERLERLARQQMKRVPRYQGDFSSLEENHILFGRMGRPDAPVLVESVYTTRIVGCMGVYYEVSVSSFQAVALPSITTFCGT